ncbi:MAG: ROK family transcriptional regulator, partial [Spirochaetota bacterium]
MRDLRKQSQANVKYNNLQLCLQTIIQNEPLSRADIVRITHISKPTVSNLIDALIAKKIVYEIGTGKSLGGRKPILLKFNSEKKLLLAFEMGRSGYRIALSDLKGKILKKADDEFENEKDARSRSLTIKNALLKFLQEADVNRKSLLKVICIAPGIYPGRKKEPTMAYGYKGLTENDVKEYFYDVFKQEVVLNHSTKLSLLGEKMAGKAKGYRTVVYFDFAYGLACALMIDGNIYYGHDNSSGEIGYFYSSLEEFNTNKIRPYDFGMLESKISGKAIQEIALKEVKRNKSS